MTASVEFLNGLSEFIAVTVRSATPLLIAGIGHLVMLRSGIVNIGVEGLMLTGAFAGVIGTQYSGNAWIGVLAAGAAAGVGGLIFAYFTVTLAANQIVTGAAINTLAMGIISTLERALFGINVAPPQIAAFENQAIPLLSRIPIIGPALFMHTALVYVAFALVPVAHFMLFRTSIGLDMRSVGEYPKAADTVGIDVFAMRYAAIIVGAILSGMAGAYLSLGHLDFFTGNMIAGRGFIALAAVIFGKYSPLGTLGATLLFGAGSALQFRLQATGSAIPQEFLIMVPYVLTIVTLLGLIGKSTSPAALGRPYTKE